MDNRRFNGGHPTKGGRKKGIGLSFTIQKHCQRFIIELLQDEKIKTRAIQQLIEFEE